MGIKIKGIQDIRDSREKTFRWVYIGKQKSACEGELRDKGDVWGRPMSRVGMLTRDASGMAWTRISSVSSTRTFEPIC